jgi:hypothetical protein
MIALRGFRSINASTLRWSVDTSLLSSAATEKLGPHPRTRRFDRQAKAHARHASSRSTLGREGVKRGRRLDAHLLDVISEAKMMSR